MAQLPPVMPDAVHLPHWAVDQAVPEVGTEAVAPARPALAAGRADSRANEQKGPGPFYSRLRPVCCLQSRSFEPLNVNLLIQGPTYSG